MAEARKVIITGSSGFLGRRLYDRLKDSYEVFGFDIERGQDIRREEDFRDLNADYVIHLAALMRNVREETILDVNVNGTLNVLNFCRSIGTKLVFASSASVYGNAKPPVSEDSPLKPDSFYSLTKLFGERLCEFYNRKFSIPTTIVRIFNMYGPKQQEGLLIPDIIAKLEEEKIVLGNPYPRRDYVYVDDVVDAIARSMELDGFNCINVGTGRSYSVKEVAEMLLEISGKRKKIEFSDYLKVDSDSRADISRAKRLLGWEPKISLEEGLRRILS